jgi:DNA polymerase
MKAFVRFRQVPDQERPGEVLHVAWFEPAHHVVEAVAPWFARRFANMRWAILTPERSVRWDGEQLLFGPGGGRHDAPAADAGEELWLTYYESIFNPARLKLQQMNKEMPRKYWHNLPEARLIGELSAQAQQRSEAMIERPAQAPRRRIPQPVAVEPEDTLAQDGLTSLEQLKSATMKCRECPIGEFATQSVNGEGRLHAPLMFVGEQPGDQEDLQGHPFVGPAGKLLDRALQALEIPRDIVFVSNAVKHFKFELRGKRRIHKTPTQREGAACLHWLEDEIALVQPKALVALGSTAARSLMGHAVSVTAERGKWLTRADGRKVLITLHPSALLRMPPEERDEAFAAFVADLKKAKSVV